MNDEEKLGVFPVKEWLQLGLNEQEIAEKMTEILALESGLDGLTE